MKILDLKYADIHGWRLDSLPLTDGLNLLVGATGAGKTKTLNMLFNLGCFAAGTQKVGGADWTILAHHKNKKFSWTCKTDVHSGLLIVSKEEIKYLKENGTEELIVSRDASNFLFQGTRMPRLDPSSSAISILKEDPALNDVHDGFSKIMRRSFWGPDLTNQMSYSSIPKALMEELSVNSSTERLLSVDLPLSAKLFIVQEKFPRIFDSIVEYFKQVFPFTSDIRVRLTNNLPNVVMQDTFALCEIREKHSNDYIPISEMASGMQKVLLIITDVMCGPQDFLYLLDEYENSLGLNAIDFLPPFLVEFGGERQFLVTSHHPYAINAVPVSNWFVFHRKGTHIFVEHGQGLEDRYGKSRHQRFTQLINDPFYREGIE